MVKCCNRGYATSEILLAGRQVRPSTRRCADGLSLLSARIGTSELVPSYASDDDIAGVLQRTQFSAFRIRRRIVSRGECGETFARRNCHRGTGALGQYPPNCVQVGSEAAALLQAQSPSDSGFGALEQHKNQCGSMVVHHLDLWRFYELRRFVLQLTSRRSLLSAPNLVIVRVVELARASR